jgi:hypothetical protein
MREFFRGWRQKVGVLTLLLACLFMAGWVRSLTTFSQVICPLATHNYVSFVFHRQSFRVVLEFDEVESSSWSDSSFFSMPIDKIKEIEPEWMEWGENPENFCLNMPFRLRRKADWVHPQTYCVRTVSLTYWPIALPLTAMSTILLISNPRLRNRALKSRD